MTKAKIGRGVQGHLLADKRLHELGRRGPGVTLAEERGRRLVQSKLGAKTVESRLVSLCQFAEVKTERDMSGGTLRKVYDCLITIRRLKTNTKSH